MDSDNKRVRGELEIDRSMAPKDLNRNGVIPMFAGDFFITPHAVRQFQSRIAPWMTYEEALSTVIRELRGAKDFHITENGKARYVRTRSQWQFRAVIAAGLFI